MRIYANASEMRSEVERDLFEMGIRYQSSTVQDQNVADDPRFQTIELVGYGYVLKNTDIGSDEMMKMLTDSNANVRWATDELVERTKRQRYQPNPGVAWAKNHEFWKPFIREGVFSYSYAERWLEQIPYVVNELNRRPNTRQVVMTMYDRHQDMMNWGGRDRVPCSLTYQFILRDGRLDLVYNQRSCDFVKFFATDVYLTCGLLQHVVSELLSFGDDVARGRLIHFLGSLHAFAGDLKGKEIF